MKAYIVIDKDFDLSFFNKELDLTRYCPNLYFSIQEAIDSIREYDKFYIVEILFTNNRQILESIYNSYTGFKTDKLEVLLCKIITVKV